MYGGRMPSLPQCFLHQDLTSVSMQLTLPLIQLIHISTRNITRQVGFGGWVLVQSLCVILMNLTWSSAWSKRLIVTKFSTVNIYVTDNVSVIPVCRGTKLVSKLPSPSAFTSWQWYRTWVLPAFCSGFQQPVGWELPCALDYWEIRGEGVSLFGARKKIVESCCWWSRCKALPHWRLRWRWVSWTGEHCWDDTLQRLHSLCPRTASNTQSEDKTDWRIKWSR